MNLKIRKIMINFTVMFYFLNDLLNENNYEF